MWIESAITIYVTLCNINIYCNMMFLGKSFDSRHVWMLLANPAIPDKSMMQKLYKKSSFASRHTCSLMQHFTGTHSKPIKDPWSPHWKPLNLLLVMLSVGLPPAGRTRLHVKPKKWYFLLLLLYYYSIYCQSKWRVLMCLLSDGTTTQPQANGTHKNQMGQAEGRSTHTHTHTYRFFFSLPLSLPPHFSPLLLFISSCLFSLFITSLSEPLKLRAGLAGVPLRSLW